MTIFLLSPNYQMETSVIKLTHMKELIASHIDKKFGKIYKSKNWITVNLDEKEEKPSKHPDDDPNWYMKFNLPDEIIEFLLTDSIEMTVDVKTCEILSESIKNLKSNTCFGTHSWGLSSAGIETFKSLLADCIKHSTPLYISKTLF